jgi:hypothetical protein
LASFYDVLCVGFNFVRLFDFFFFFLIKKNWVGEDDQRGFSTWA